MWKTTIDKIDINVDDKNQEQQVEIQSFDNRSSLGDYMQRETVKEQRLIEFSELRIRKNQFVRDFLTRTDKLT